MTMCWNTEKYSFCLCFTCYCVVLLRLLLAAFYISATCSISIGSSIQSVSWQICVACLNMHISIVKIICIVKRKVVGKCIDLVLVIYCQLMFL